MFYSSVVQLVHDGWKIIEYTVGHATSYVLYCTFDYKDVLVGENRGEMENASVTQGFTYRGFCSTFPLYSSTFPLYMYV